MKLFTAIKNQVIKIGFVNMNCINYDGTINPDHRSKTEIIDFT